jgi:hypothetical protein
VGSALLGSLLGILGHQTNLDIVAVAVVASILTGGFVVLRLEVAPMTTCSFSSRNGWEARVN